VRARIIPANSSSDSGATRPASVDINVVFLSDFAVLIPFFADAGRSGRLLTEADVGAGLCERDQTDIGQKISGHHLYFSSQTKDSLLSEAVFGLHKRRPARSLARMIQMLQAATS
jgi:hypothetical protein